MIEPRDEKSIKIIRMSGRSHKQPIARLKRAKAKQDRELR